MPDVLKAEFEKITAAFLKYKDDAEFNAELNDLYAHYVGRPSPVYFAKNLSRKHGTDIYLKREDLNHTGAYKINHCLGEALLAKRIGKKKIIAETGAGQHGVALATAAALTGLECDIYIGAIDVDKEKPNVDRMQLLWAKVISVAGGTRTLKDAVDAAFFACRRLTCSRCFSVLCGTTCSVISDFRNLQVGGVFLESNPCTRGEPVCPRRFLS